MTSDQLLALESTFAWLFSSPDEIARVCRRADLAPPRTLQDTAARDTWHSVLTTADQQGTGAIRRLLEAGLTDYPDQVALKAFITLLEYVEEYGVDVVQRRAAPPPVAPAREAEFEPTGDKADIDLVAVPDDVPPASREAVTPSAPDPSARPALSPMGRRPTAAGGPARRSAGPPERPLSAFYVFAQRDERYAQQMEEVLQSLQREGLFSRWGHRRVSDPARWRNKLSHNLEEADLVVFLVSHALIDSGYLADMEASWALDMHGRGQAKVVPVRLEDVPWQATPLSRLDPVPAGPLPDWTTRGAWRALAGRIREVVEPLRYR